MQNCLAAVSILIITQGTVIWFHTITGLDIRPVLELCFYLCYSKFKAITQGQ